MMESQPTTCNACGYKRLADFMAWNPPGAIFPRFRAANAFNLLGLQAEVCRLQQKLMRQVEADEKQDPARTRFQVDWSALQDEERGSSEQKQLVMKLRQTLNEYSRPLDLSLMSAARRKSYITKRISFLPVLKFVLSQIAASSSRSP